MSFDSISVWKEAFKVKAINVWPFSSEAEFWGVLSMLYYIKIIMAGANPGLVHIHSYICIYENIYIYFKFLRWRQVWGQTPKAQIFKQWSFLLTTGYFPLDLLCFSFRKFCFSFWIFYTGILCLNKRIFCCCSIRVDILLGVASSESPRPDLSSTGFWTGCFYVLKLCKHV